MATVALAYCTRRGVADGAIHQYIRYELQGKAAYGILDGDTVRELSGAPWAGGKPTGQNHQVRGREAARAG